MLGAHIVLLTSSSGRYLAVDGIRAGLSGRPHAEPGRWGTAVVVGLYSIAGSLRGPTRCERPPDRHLQPRGGPGRLQPRRRPRHRRRWWSPPGVRTHRCRRGIRGSRARVGRGNPHAGPGRFTDRFLGGGGTSTALPPHHGTRGVRPSQDLGLNSSRTHPCADPPAPGAPVTTAIAAAKSVDVHVGRCWRGITWIR